MFWIIAYLLSLYILFITFKLHFKNKINAFEKKLIMPSAVLFSLPILAVSSIAVEVLYLSGIAITALITAGSFVSYFTLVYAYKAARKDMEKKQATE